MTQNMHEQIVEVILCDVRNSRVQAIHRFSIGAFTDEQAADFIANFRDLLLCETERYFRENTWREFPLLTLDVDWDSSEILVHPMGELSVAEKATMRMNIEALPGVVMKLKYFRDALLEAEAMETVPADKVKNEEVVSNAEVGDSKPKKKRTTIDDDSIKMIANFAARNPAMIYKELAKHFGLYQKIFSKNKKLRTAVDFARSGLVPPKQSDKERDPNTQDAEYKELLRNLSKK